MATKKSTAGKPAKSRLVDVASSGSAASKSLFRHYHAGLSFAKLMTGKIDERKYAQDLCAKMQGATDNELREYEMMLAAQADTLDSIFSSLVYQAAGAENAPQLQLRLSLALKAQAQCRATVEVLAEIKNPRPVAFIKQANMTAGPQQINNGAVPHARPRTSAETSNELLENSDGERVDARTTGQAGRSDPSVAAVGEVHRSDI